MLTPFMPPPGLNSDDTTFKAEGRWADGNNVRFVNGAPQVVGESKALFSTLGDAIYGMFAWDRSGTTYIAYGLSAAIHIAEGAVSPTARTPASMGTGYTAWAFAAWGSTLLFVPSGKTLYEQSGTSTATEVTQAPDKITWMLVTPERQVLALGCNEEGSGTFNNLCIRGSDIEDYTDWTTTSSNNAFEHILSGGGKIVVGHMVGSYVAVWTDNALHMGQFLGDPGQTYRFDRVAENCGALAPKAVTVVGQRAYWVGKDLLLRTWAPGAEVEVIPCPIFRDFSAAAFAVNAFGTVLVHVVRFNEIRIYYQETDAGKFIAVSLIDGTWHKGDQDASSAYTSDLLHSAFGTTYASNMIVGGANGIAYASECGVNVVQDWPTSWFVQSADQYLDNSQRRLMIRGVLPDFSTMTGGTNANTVALALFVRDRPQSTAVSKGPFNITAGAAKKNFRASGKVVAVKLSQSTVDRELRIGKLVFDVVPMGER